MDGVPLTGRETTLRRSVSEVTGAVGDSVTVLPIAVGVAVLTDLSLALMLVWFGVFQVVWGLHFGVPLSVEPMKALAAMLLAGVVTTGEFLVAGLLAGGLLLVVGATGSIGRVERFIGDPVVRGIQFAVALLLLETGANLAVRNPPLAAAAVGIAVVAIVLGYARASGLVVLVAGGGVAAAAVGVPSVVVPSVDVAAHLSMASLTVGALEATVAQLAMSIGNAAVATSVLVQEYFDREISADELSTSMGLMTLLAVPAGGLPMCHGSGGVAGKYAFGARTASANLVLGAAYLLVAVGATGLVMAYPLSMLGVILAIVALQLGRTGLQTAHPAFVVGIGLVGALVNVGAAFVVGTVAYLLLARRGRFETGQ